MLAGRRFGSRIRDRLSHVDKPADVLSEGDRV